MPADASTQLESKTVMSMLGYSLCSASMLVINKMALRAIPLPGIISVAQFVFAAVSIALIKASGMAPVDDFVWSKVRAYVLYVALFVVGIYTNMKSVQYANIETVIVFRACCPVFVCVLDWAFLGRQLPSARSALSLLLIVLGAAGYVSADKQFAVDGLAAYGWVSVYTLTAALQMAYGKVIVGPGMKFLSMWGPTQYTNVLSIPPMLAIAAIADEPHKSQTVEWSVHAVLVLLASCVVGLAISFTGWQCRSLVTATCYTVLGVANKMLTVLINMLVWDAHASPLGVAWLVLCLAGATAYQQAPLREDSKASTPAAMDDKQGLLSTASPDSEDAEGKSDGGKR